MTALRAANLVILCGLFACLGRPAAAVYTMSQTCKLYSGYIADPSDCQGWGLCSNLTLIGTGKCAAGLLYDSRNGMCNYADQVECSTNKASLCKGLNSVFRADPNDCTQYCYCENGVAVCDRCPEGQRYNPTLNSCVWFLSYPNCAADSPCRLVPNSKFMADPDPKHCGDYLLCVDGSGRSGKCQTGYVFNPSNGRCDTVTSMECSDPSGENNGSSEEKEPDVAAICKKNFKASAASKTQFFSDLQTCDRYVACESASYGNWQKCPFATHFNPATQTCVTPFTYACPYNRCANLNLDFVTAYGTECGAYVRCNNQLNVTAPQTCSGVSPDYKYFEENLGGCVKVKPNQGICEAIVQ